MAANKPVYIIDASVILKWFLNEPEFQYEARAIRQDYVEDTVELIAPDYAYAEVLNTCGRELSFDKALAAFSQLMECQLYECRITLELASVACELMGKFPGITFYDAGYHALALQEGGTFVTADRKYYEKTKKRGHVMLLKDYGKKR